MSYRSLYCTLVSSYNVIVAHTLYDARKCYYCSCTKMGNCFSAEETHKGIYSPFLRHITRDGLVFPSDSFTYITTHTYPVLHLLPRLHLSMSSKTKDKTPSAQ